MSPLGQPLVAAIAPRGVPGDEPTGRRHLDPRAAAELAAAAASGFALTWSIARVTALGTSLGALLVWYLSSVVLYRYTVTALHGTLAARERLTTLFVWSGAAVAAVPIVLIVADVVQKGAGAVRLNFFTQTSAKAGPLVPATKGGALQAVVGTVEQVGIAIAVAVPLGILVAVYLSEVGGPTTRVLRVVVEAMSGLPSIVAGVFVYTVLVSGLRGGDSGVAGALALVVVMLPIVARTAEEILRLVPGGLRESALALGAPQWRTVTRVVLPTAKSGLITAAILAVARAAGETAPLILTAGGNVRLNANPLHGLQDALPLYVFGRVHSSSNVEVQRAWTGAFVLIALVIGLFTLARLLGGRGQRKRGRPQ